MNSTHPQTSRRSALRVIGQAAALLAAAASPAMAAAKAPEQQSSATVPSAGALNALGQRLANAPRRRGFQTVPFVLTSPDLWDHEAAAEVLAYKYRSLQMWESTELAAPWINLMREAINGQVFSHGNPDFLAVAAVHGTAHLALFNQAAWDKYKLAELTGGKFSSNSFIIEKAGVSANDDLKDLEGFYGPANNNVISLQRRGAVFIGCHDSIHAIARKLHGLSNYAEIPADTIAADLTNSLIPGIVLVPSVVAFLVELQGAGFTYAKGD
jgi:hypothetical protein